MILKHLKQLTLSSATRRNAHLLRLPRLYSSPAFCHQSLTTSKPSKRLSRDDRRLVVESFVTKYREANAGKFPTLTATVKEVGGSYYVVRDILQELKLRPNAPISRVSASAPSDASLLKQDHAVDSPHPSSDEVSLQEDNNLAVTATRDKSETETASLDKDVGSKCGGSTRLPENQTLKVAEECLKNSETKDEGTLAQLVSQEPKVDHLEGASVLPARHVQGESETVPPNNDVDSNCDLITRLPVSQPSMLSEVCLKNSEPKEERKLTPLGSQEPKADHIEGANDLPTETSYQSNVITATDVERETEIALPNIDVDSKCDATTHLPDSQNLMVSEECKKNSETEEERKLTHLGSQEPKPDHLKRVANVLPTETRQVPEKRDGEVKTGEDSSAWSNIISLVKELASFWRKG